MLERITYQTLIPMKFYVNFLQTQMAPLKGDRGQPIITSILSRGHSESLIQVKTFNQMNNFCEHLHH